MILALVVLGVPSVAGAATTIGDCNGVGAPTPLEDESCHGMCSLAFAAGVATMNCGGASVCDEDTVAYVVYNYDNEGVISAFGVCDDPGTPLPFCCVLDDDDEVVRKVVLRGAGGDDELRFTTADEDSDVNLEPHLGETLLKGVIYAGDGDDETEGSKFVSHRFFKEYHFGEDGSDTITLHDGDDYGEEGDGGGTIDAGGGADVCWADDGPDDMTGGPGDDCVIDGLNCPHSLVTGQTFEGEDGDDLMWVGFGGASCGDDTDFDVDEGTGADLCGDADWGTGPFTSCTLTSDWSDMSATCSKQSP